MGSKHKKKRFSKKHVHINDYEDEAKEARARNARELEIAERERNKPVAPIRYTYTTRYNSSTGRYEDVRVPIEESERRSSFWA